MNSVTSNYKLNIYQNSLGTVEDREKDMIIAAKNYKNSALHKFKLCYHTGIGEFTQLHIIEDRIIQFDNKVPAAGMVGSSVFNAAGSIIMFSARKIPQKTGYISRKGGGFVCALK